MFLAHAVPRALSWLAGLMTASVLGVAAATASEGALVSTEWLEKNLKDPKLRIIEVSVEPGVFERGHIPGAQNIVWHTDLVQTVNRDIASRDQFEALVRRLGIENDTTVILYGDNNNWFAAWGAWVFDIYGLRDNVKLLDGGRKKWELEGRPLATTATTVAASSITIPEPNLKLRARLTDVLGVVEGKENKAILDIRSADEFSGKIIAPQGSKELAVRAGHIPGALNVAWAKAVDKDTGALLPADKLRKLYADAGIDGSKPVITTCRIGERSSHTWFVLTRVLGYHTNGLHN